MQDKHFYEYAVIRVLPKVEREEFINVGLILFSKKAKYIKSHFHIDENKWALFDSELDIESLYAHLEAFNKICMGTAGDSNIASLDIAERFRWLTATRSTCLQTSPQRSGFSSDLNATFERLYNELVL